MWFKNIQLFEFADAIQYQPEALDEALSGQRFKPCSKVTPATQGWVAPIGDGEEAPLVYGSNGHMIICLKIEEKILPATVVREHLNSRVAEIEAAQGRKLYKNDKASLKDDIYHQLLAQAFTKSTRIYAVIDSKNKRLVVDASSQSRLEAFLVLFNHSATDHKIHVPEFKSTGALMTRWLKNHRYPAGFAISQHCVIEDTTDERGVARYRNTDLQNDSVQTLLKDGCLVTQLGMSWHDRVEFTLKDNGGMSGVRFTDAVKDLANDGMTETAEERFAADFVIMAETMQQFLDDMLPNVLADETEMAATTKSETVAA